MNKKTDEPIKLTVSEVKPEESLLAPEEPILSGSSSVVNDLYSEKAVEDSNNDDVGGNLGNVTKTAKSPKKGFLLFVGGLLLGGVITGGIFGFVINPKRAVSTPTPVVEVTPEVTKAVEELDYSQYSVKILNGSGVTGAAAGVKGLLGELKFKNVQTGNASVSNQKETTVQFKKDVPAAIFEKLNQLLVKYNVVEGDSLEDSLGSDIQIIVGTQK